MPHHLSICTGQNNLPNQSQSVPATLNVPINDKKDFNILPNPTKSSKCLNMDWVEVYPPSHTLVSGQPDDGFVEVQTPALTRDYLEYLKQTDGAAYHIIVADLWVGLQSK